MQVWEATQECPKPRDQALSLWSGSTDSKTLDYQRTNPREYQIVRTHTKETTWIRDLAHSTTSSTLCSTPHLNDKQSKNTNPVISRQDYHLTQPCPSEEKKKNSAWISPYTKLTQTTGPTLGLMYHLPPPCASTAVPSLLPRPLCRAGQQALQITGFMSQYLYVDHVAKCKSILVT